MTATMLAARAHPGEKQFRLEEVPVPQPGPGEVVVRVRAAGLTRGLLAVWFFTDRIRLLPATLGHEIAGEVSAVGADVPGARAGDRVAVTTALTCGNCPPCRAGAETLCQNLATIGYALYSDGGLDRYQRYHNGGFAEYVLVPAENLDPLPERVSYPVGAKVHTLAGAWHALGTAIPDGGSVTVTAATGAAGVSVLRCAGLRGASAVLAVGRRSSHVATAVALAGGSTVHAVALDALPDDWGATGRLTGVIRERTGGAGTDGLVDYSPMDVAATAQAILGLRPGGTAVLVGGSVAPLTLDYGQMMRNQYRMFGQRGAPRAATGQVSDLLADGQLAADDLVTHRFPLTEINQAVRTVFNRTDQPIFVVVEP